MSENAILDYAAEKFGTQQATSEAEIAQVATEPTPEAQEPTEIVAGQVAESEATPEATAEAAGTPEAEAEPSTESTETQPETVDFWARLSELTEGAAKDEDSFKAILDRNKGYDELSKAKEELEQNQFKPANGYIETLNKLTLDGASKDQIAAFIKTEQHR